MRCGQLFAARVQVSKKTPRSWGLPASPAHTRFTPHSARSLWRTGNLPRQRNGCGGCPCLFRPPRCNRGAPELDSSGELARREDPRRSVEARSEGLRARGCRAFELGGDRHPRGSRGCLARRSCPSRQEPRRRHSSAPRLGRSGRGNLVHTQRSMKRRGSGFLPKPGKSSPTRSTVLASAKTVPCPNKATRWVPDCRRMAVSVVRGAPDVAITARALPVGGKKAPRPFVISEPASSAGRVRYLQGARGC